MIEEKRVRTTMLTQGQMIENANGGKHSGTPFAFHLLPTSAVFAAADSMRRGAEKFGETFEKRNYMKFSAEEHINRCIQHLYFYLDGDRSKDHLASAILRAMFAYEVDRNDLIRGGVTKNAE